MTELCTAIAVNERHEPVLFCWLRPNHRSEHWDREVKVKWRPDEPGDPAGVPALMKPSPPGGRDAVKRRHVFKRVSRFDPDEQMAQAREKTRVLCLSISS